MAGFAAYTTMLPVLQRDWALSNSEAGLISGIFFAGYVVVIIQTFYAPKLIIALAYDSGGVTTSTVTVPLVTALGLGLASTVPGRSPMLDGFGLIAFASLFPIMSVMAYAQLSEWRARRYRQRDNLGE